MSRGINGARTTDQHLVERAVYSVTAEKDLIGRQIEWGLLRRVLDGIEDEGSTVVVRGQPGVGKSSLLHATRTHAAVVGARVLDVSGIESHAMSPFAGLHHLLQPLLRQAWSLPAVQRRALLTALGLSSGPAPELFLTALAALTLIVDAAAARPVVLLVDDLQWLDAPSADALGFLSRRLRHDPVVMIAAIRDGHATSIDSTESIEIELRGLQPEHSEELLAAVAGDLTAADRAAVLEQATGNPLALVELPSAWRSAGVDLLGPPSATVPLSTRLERAFAARIDELPDRTRDALLVAAVSAEPNVAEVLAAAGALASAPVHMEDLEPAVNARLVTVNQVDIRFRHPLMRSGVLLREPGERRRAAHAAMSRVLTAEPYRCVWHQAQAVDGQDDEVAQRLDDSHRESMRRGSVLSAIAALERAAQLTSDREVRAGRRLLAAQHAFGLGRADLVNRLVDAAEVDGLTARDQARAAWLRELFSEGTLGDSARVRELCALATSSATGGETSLALDLLASAALRCWWAVSDVADRAHVADAAAAWSGLEDDARVIATIAVAHPLGHTSFVLRQLDGVRPADVIDADQLRQYGMAARAVGAEPVAADFFQAAELRLRDNGQLGLLSHVLAVQAAVCIDLGDWRRAGHSLAEGRRLSDETGQSTWRTGTAVVEAVYLGVTGRTDDAFARAAEIEAACAGDVAGDFLSLVQLARATAHLSLGNPAAAFDALLPVFDHAAPCHHPREQLSALSFFVEAALACGHHTQARRIVDRFEALYLTAPSPILGVHLAYARAVLAGDDEAEPLFCSALAQDLTRWPWPRARLELAYGDWLRRRRRLVDSRLPLRASLTTFDALGAVRWAAQARSGLRAAGERTTGNDANSLAASLTAQEVQIARLAAEGRSNREIGQQLYLSPRTVGSHLYRIFPKLGITSRAQLHERVGTRIAPEGEY